MVPNIQKDTLGQQGSTLKPLQESVVSSINVATNSSTKMASNTRNTRLKSTSLKKFNRSSSWQELSPEPDFHIGLIIDSTWTKDVHVSAMNKPASRCILTSVVVLEPDPGETETSIRDSVSRWLEVNKVFANVEDLDFIGTGRGGCDEMLSLEFIDAVYVLVPPRYVGCLCIQSYATACFGVIRVSYIGQLFRLFIATAPRRNT